MWNRLLRRRQPNKKTEKLRHRVLSHENLERRILMTADPIHVGIVYIETDYLESEADSGEDFRPDRFILSFTGGAPDTELREVRIRTDKDGDGLSVGDSLFDTTDGGRGKDGSHDFAIQKIDSTGNVDVKASVTDGGQELIIRLDGFYAGDRMEFTLDVDEILRNSADIDEFNRKLDVITSGQEFEDSILEARFEAPYYENADADSRFLNLFGDPESTYGLNLPPDQGNGVDSRPDRSAAAIASVTQVAKPISLSGYVWLDNDLDLKRENQESGLPGVEISLFQLNTNGNQFVDTGHRATTDQNGQYVFGKNLNLLPGTYRVVETQPLGLFSVGAVLGQIEGLSVGQISNTDILTDILFLNGDTDGVEYNFAEADPASISGYVYRDDSDDGIRDSNEPGLEGVRVQLVPVSTIAAQSSITTTTDANGFYRFTGLAPGQYQVVELDQPANLSDGRDTPGTVEGTAVGSADNPGDILSEIQLTGGQAGIEYNFGELPLGSIGGFVYIASPGEDCNGARHTGDVPLAGVRVVLEDGQGQTVSETITDNDGAYRFDALPKGIYTIREFTPSNLIDGAAHEGSIESVKVGEALGGGLIRQILLPAGGKGVEYNFCEAAPASLTGHVYHDASNDGNRDAGETPLEDVLIRLRAANGSVVSETRTDSAGLYRFDDLIPGTYTIEEIQPSGWYDGQDAAGTVAGDIVGIAENPGDQIGQVSLRQGQQGINYDFGELMPASLSGQVHVDLDQDCLLDPGETLLAGVVLRLIDASGNEVQRTETDINGRYRFDNLRPGTYTVIEEQPDGYFPGKSVAGTAGGNTSVSNQIGSIDLTSGENGINYNFCEDPPAEISGYVFNDFDQDCNFDSTDQPLQDVVVELLDDTGQVVATTRTDSNGKYQFSGLEAGRYTIREIQPIGLLHGGQKIGNGGGDASQPDLLASIDLAYGDQLVDYNFCELAPSSIAGQIIADRDGDCELDPDETPLSGVRVQLYDALGSLVGETKTDSTGHYQFTNLRPGQYRIVEIQPEGYFQGGQQVGSGGGSVLTDNVIGQIQVGPGEDLVHYNFCELEPSSIAGQVFVDHDGDCTLDVGEEPLAGVRIQLVDAQGNLVGETTTDALGRYQFDNLRAGQYRVVELQPDGYFQGGQKAGSGGGTVLEDDVIGEIQIGPGATLVNYNFCEQAGAKISGKVWSETDLNQQYDPTDTPLAGVVVELRNQAGVIVQQLITDESGEYAFCDLEPGIYSVREVQPETHFHGGQVLGTAGGTVVADDHIATIQVGSGTRATGYNFPEVPPATLSGFVFQDGPILFTSTIPLPEQMRNYRDGLRTVDDVPLSGVTLELRNALGGPLTADRALEGVYPDGPIRVETDSNGFYSFTGLRPGTFHVYEIQPQSFIDSLDTPGTTGGVAVNVADIPDNIDLQFIVQTLAANENSDPRNDAVLNIQLSAGDHSSNNNFSEILVDVNAIPPLPPIDPLPPVLIPDTPVSIIHGVPPLIPVNPIVHVQYPPLESIKVPGPSVSWHLSIINGGFPRGENVAGRPDGVIRPISERTEHNGEWDHKSCQCGQWSLYTQSGEHLGWSESFVLGDEGGIPVAGDFNGDRRDEIGIFVGGQWFIDFNGNGRWDPGDLWVELGNQWDRPVTGDWDGDGKQDVGIFGLEWYRDPTAIINEPGLPDPANQRKAKPKNTPPTAEEAAVGKRWLKRGKEGVMRADLIDHVFRYGHYPDTPIAGDWNGDGIDAIAIFREGRWLLDSDGDGRWTEIDRGFVFGESGDQAIVGDWNGDGIDDLGVVRGDLWIIDSNGDHQLTENDKRIEIPKPSANAKPVAGDWDGDGRDEPGYYHTTSADRSNDNGAEHQTRPAA